MIKAIYATKSDALAYYLPYGYLKTSFSNAQEPMDLFSDVGKQKSKGARVYAQPILHRNGAALLEV